MKNITAKAIAIGGLTAIGAIATVPFLGSVALTGVATYTTWGIVGIASITIAKIKDKTPHDLLVKEIKSTFKYNQKQAEDFADKLRDKGIKEYFKIYDESTITREE